MTRWIRIAVAVLALASAVACSGDAPPPRRPSRLSAVWTWHVPGAGSAGMPAVSGDHVAVTHSLGSLVLLEAGRLRWQTDQPGLRDVAPLITGELVLAATEGGVAAFDRATGTLRWQTRLADRASSPVLAAPDLAAVAWWNGGLAAVGTEDGAVRWEHGLPGLAIGPPAAGDGLVVVTWERGEEAGIVAVDAGSGQHRWAVGLPGFGVSAPAIVAAHGVAVVVAGDGTARAFGLASGEQRWATPVDGAGSPEVPPVAGGGGVTVVTRLAHVVHLDAATGARRWASDSLGSAVRGGPVRLGPEEVALPVDDGRLFFVDPVGLPHVTDPPGRVSGVATAAGRVVVVATREEQQNSVYAIRVRPT
jgi:outer membrane protein assembly factor BamB